MLLKLYDKNNVLKMEIAPSESSSHQQEIQSDNLLSLSFVSFERVSFDIGDYIDFIGVRFYVAEQYTPEQISTVEWEYSVSLYGVESMIKRYLVLKLVNGAYEPNFAYTASAYDHVKLIVDSINDGMGTTEWKVGEVVASELFVLDYEGTYCDQGLANVAEYCNVEYWIQGTTINVSRCEHGENITLGYGNGLTSLYADTADNVKFFTRLFPIGSTRNIVFSDYGSDRLQLPNGQKYVDKDVDKFGVVHQYEESAFSHIYPHRIGVISSVRSEQVIGENGEPFIIYFFADEGMDFDPNNYEIEGLVKMASFQSGNLDGRDFEVNFYSETKEFEVITQQPYDNEIRLPNEELPPKVGDEYILWNIRMPQEYYPLAEKAYLEAVDEYIANSRTDVTVYTASTDYINIAERGIILSVGQRVRLESVYLQNGYRDSRITKITRNLIRPTEMDIKISDVLSQGVFDSIDSEIADLKHYTQAMAGGLPDIIKSWEGTLPTDTNLLSARATNLRHIRKDMADRSRYSIASDSGFEVGKYISGILGEGAYFGIDGYGKTFLEVDNITARIKAIFSTLEINKIQANSGNRIATAASMTCSSVVEYDDYYRCFFVAQGDDLTIANDFIVGDLAMSRTFSLINEDGNEFSRHYWREVVGVGADYIDLSKSKAMANSDITIEGDVIVQLGHTTDTLRQNALVEESVGIGAPSYTLHKGINTFSLNDTAIIRLGFDSATNVPSLDVYGDCYIGDADESSYIKYDSQAKQLGVKASVSVLPGSTGLEGFNEWPDKQSAIDKINNLRIGGNNLLLNSGFIGQSNSLSLTADTALSSNSEMFSPSFEGWTGTAEVISMDSISGKGITAGSASQNMEDLIVGEKYAISLRAKGNSVTVTCGDESQHFPLTDTLTSYWAFVTFSGSPIFTVTIDGEAGDIQLERGTIVTDWGFSPKDTNKVASEFVAYNYLLSAIHGGQTEIVGGLILSNVIQLMMADKVTAGISGIAVKETNPAIWAGGDFASAVRMATRFKDNPYYRPTTEEWLSLASFVVTHGGDAFFRGYINALGGIFTNCDAVNLSVSGSFKNPYVSISDLSWKNENNIVFDSGESGDYVMPAAMFSADSIGRRMNLVVWNFDSNSTSGRITIKSAIGGTWFYENGISHSEIDFSNELLTLEGIGDANSGTFYGYVVTNRKLIHTRHTYGSAPTILAEGQFGYKSSPGETQFAFRTFDGSVLKLEHLSTGQYKITLPNTWNVERDGYYVTTTGMVTAQNTPAKASFIGRTFNEATNEASFYISVSDDDSPNDGSFIFQVYPLSLSEGWQFEYM